MFDLDDIDEQGPDAPSVLWEYGELLDLRMNYLPDVDAILDRFLLEQRGVICKIAWLVDDPVFDYNQRHCLLNRSRDIKTVLYQELGYLNRQQGMLEDRIQMFADLLSGK